MSTFLCSFQFAQFIIIDAEQFVREKCAIFLILPEEDATKNFVASLMIQNLARELFSVANEHGGRLPKQCDNCFHGIAKEQIH